MQRYLKVCLLGFSVCMSGLVDANGDTTPPEIYSQGLGGDATWGSVYSGGTCNTEGWSNNYIGINPADYAAAPEILSPGNIFLADGIAWYIDAIVTNPGNCNNGNVLVYVVRTAEEVDGNWWETFDPTINVNLAVGEPWVANAPGTPALTVDSRYVGRLLASEPVEWAIEFPTAGPADLAGVMEAPPVRIDQDGVLSIQKDLSYIPDLSFSVTATDASGNVGSLALVSIPVERAIRPAPLPVNTLSIVWLWLMAVVLAWFASRALRA